MVLCDKIYPSELRKRFNELKGKDLVLTLPSFNPTRPSVPVKKTILTMKQEYTKKSEKFPSPSKDSIRGPAPKRKRIIEEDDESSYIEIESDKNPDGGPLTEHQRNLIS